MLASIKKRLRKQVHGVCKTCAKTRLMKTSQTCASCYQKLRAAKMKPAACHTARKEHCGGLCRECYRAGGRAKRAICHPNLLQVALGLCRKCYAGLPENKARAVRVRRIKKYCLSDSEYTKLFTLQNNCCAICGKENPGHIDHCHKTKLVRGILCHSCNTGLGHFRDDVTILMVAANYLRRAEDLIICQTAV